jgi:hypothetical protein
VLCVRVKLCVTDRQTERQTDRETDRETERQDRERKTVCMETDNLSGSHSG